MPHGTQPDSIVVQLNALAGGLFLLSTFGMVATRQVQGCMRFFILQSVFLASSAFLLGLQPLSWHLIAVAIINLINKPILIPWLLKRTVSGEVYARREITQVLNIPISLLVALGLTMGAYFFTSPLLRFAEGSSAVVNLPIGLATLLLGAFTLTVRREAVPQLLGLLSMENGAFFASIAIAPELHLFVELVIAFDVLIAVFVIGVLTRAIHEHIGTTDVGSLAVLKEESSR
jgi:hydrogenase-4 membrane subunit HyfE